MTSFVSPRARSAAWQVARGGLAVRRTLGAFVGGATLLVFAACEGGADGGVPPLGDAGPIASCEALRLEGEARPRPLVLFVADTLRRDRLGAYGGPARTPRFDAFADRHHLFTRVTSQSPWTKPSMATLFTGENPSTHGVLSHPELRRGASGEQVLESDVLAPGALTLAEILEEAGYRTAGFVSNPWMQAELGFDQGFQTFDDSLASNATPGTQVSQAGLRWLRAQPEDGRPWFLYLHSMDAHAPYTGVGRERMKEALAGIREDDRPLSPRAARGIAQRARDPQGRPWVRAGVPPNLALMELVYDQGVERFDRALGLFLDGLEAIPGGEDAAVLVVSDHGEALFHRGWRGHGLGLHQDETAVPLAARLPGVSAPSRVDCPLGLVDLPATLCDYLGLDCPEGGDGRSAFDGGERYLLVEGVKGRPRNRALLNDRYKLIHRRDGPPAGAAPDASGAFALYDLVRDPEERHDLLAEGETPEVFAELEEALEAAASREPARRGPRVELDTGTQDRLEALGYLDPAPGSGDEGSAAEDLAEPTAPDAD